MARGRSHSAHAPAWRRMSILSCKHYSPPASTAARHPRWQFPYLAPRWAWLTRAHHFRPTSILPTGPQPDKSPRNGYDIGAFTVCRRVDPTGIRPWFCSETHITPPPATTLTMQASPSNYGTTDPAPGNSTEDLNSVVSIQALPNSGYHFTSWTGNVAAEQSFNYGNDEPGANRDSQLRFRSTICRFGRDG
jgi:hypothetical protein